MDLAGPAERRPARGPQVVSSWRLRDTPERRARALVAEAQGQPPEQLPHRSPAAIRGPQVVCPWRLRSTPARRARAQAPIKNNKRKRRTRCCELILDALFELLLLLPAKELCRVRTVCSSWRSVTVDPVFIACHMSRHPGPFFVGKFKHDPWHIHILDLSGRIMKTIVNSCPGHQVLLSRLPLACLAAYRNGCSVLNPASGAVHVLPQSPAPQHGKGLDFSDASTLFVLGRVASTGEYKVLRMFNSPGFWLVTQQVFDVYTINGGTANACWRARQIPEHFVEPGTSVVVDGVVYFLALSRPGKHDVPPDYILPFDLGSEEWKGSLLGPISGDSEAVNNYHKGGATVALAELKGSLVLVYHHLHLRPKYVMDLWFQSTSENGVCWVREYCIQTVIPHSIGRLRVKPLLVLDDGRLVIYVAPTGLLIIYDPKTNDHAVVQTGLLDSVGMFTGSLLSLPQEGDMV